MKISVPKGYEGTLQEAEHYYNIQKYATAKEKYVELLSAMPTSGELLLQLAYCEHSLGNYRKGISLCKQAMEYGVQTESSYRLLGTLYHDKEEYYFAEKVFDQGLVLYPNSAALLSQKGWMHWSIGEKRKGRKLLRRALSIHPNDPSVLLLKYVVELHKRKAEDTFQRLLESNISEVERLVFITEHLVQHRQYFEARETCRQALINDPTNPIIMKAHFHTEMLCHPLFRPVRLLSRLGSFGPIIITMSIWLSGIFIAFFGIFRNSTSSIITGVVLWSAALLIALWPRIAEAVFRKFVFQGDDTV